MARTQKAEWTVMVYLAADNNLDAEAIKDLEIIKSIGSTDSINIVAQYDSSQSQETKRYYLRKDTMLHEDVIASLPESNAGDPKPLSDFIDWSLTNYNANKTMLVLWGHGYGWQGNNRTNPVLVLR